MSNFSFSTVLSTSLENLLPFSSNLKLSSANSCQFGRVQKFVVWERVKEQPAFSLFPHNDFLTLLWPTLSIQAISNPLPRNINLDWSKLKAMSDNKINVTEKLKLVLEKVEISMGKGENAG